MKHRGTLFGQEARRGAAGMYDLAKSLVGSNRIATSLSMERTMAEYDTSAGKWSTVL